MTPAEFTRWLDYHKTAYPNLAKWLKENIRQQAIWERILSAVGFPEAKCATDAMLELDDQPRSYGDHPRWVKRLALEAGHGHGDAKAQLSEGPRIKDDRLVADCWRCMDYGVVSVLSPSCLKRLWRDDRSQHLTTCALACDCIRGQRKRLPHWQDGHALIRIDDVIDQAAERSREFADILDAQWHVARELLMQHHESRRPQAESLTAFAEREF